jgi:hypothetical protein
MLTRCFARVVLPEHEAPLFGFKLHRLVMMMVDIRQGRGASEMIRTAVREDQTQLESPDANENRSWSRH